MSTKFYTNALVKLMKQTNKQSSVNYFMGFLLFNNKCHKYVVDLQIDFFFETKMQLSNCGNS